MAEYLTDERKAEFLALLNGLDREELWEMDDECGEHYGETASQFGSEVAMFGDGWPGGAIDVANTRWYAEATRRVLKERFGKGVT